jgi:hypothetical protein
MRKKTKKETIYSFSTTSKYQIRGKRNKKEIMKKLGTYLMLGKSKISIFELARG